MRTPICVLILKRYYLKHSEYYPYGWITCHQSNLKMAKIGENKSGRGSIIQSLQLYLFMQEVVITIKFFGRDFDN